MSHPRKLNPKTHWTELGPLWASVSPNVRYSWPRCEATLPVWCWSLKWEGSSIWLSSLTRPPISSDPWHFLGIPRFHLLQSFCLFCKLSYHPFFFPVWVGCDLLILCPRLTLSHVTAWGDRGSFSWSSLLAKLPQAVASPGAWLFLWWPGLELDLDCPHYQHTFTTSGHLLTELHSPQLIPPEACFCRFSDLLALLADRDDCL